MKISEHLDLLIKTEAILNKIKSDNLVSKEAIDWLLTFDSSLDKVSIGSLFDYHTPSLLYLKYKEQLDKVKSLMMDTCMFFNDTQIGKLITRETRIKENLYNTHYYKDLETIRNLDTELNGRLESWCMKYQDEDLELINLKKEVDDTHKSYKREQEISKQLHYEWELEKKNLEYLYTIDFHKIILKIKNIKYALCNLNIFDNDLKKILIDENSIHYIYQLFVGLKLIEYTNYLDFVNQMAGKDIITFKKSVGTDKYIAYTINKISNELIKLEQSLNWKKTMAEYFGINNFEKKINPNDSNKTTLHTEIDNIISDAKRNTK